MILPVHRHLHNAITRVITQRFGLTEVPAFGIETPPSRAMGDLAVTVAFQLARALRKAPRAIAEELRDGLGAVPGVIEVVAAPTGYLNIFLDRPAYVLDRVVPGRAITAPTAHHPKTVVEHTAINPNKAAHVGHLRNATLGDTLARVLRHTGVPVEVQNYIDDTGVQVADVIVGFQHLEQLDAAAVAERAATTRFDYECWDLYARVTEWYDGDAARLAIRAQTLHDLEHGAPETSAIGAIVVDRIVRAHLSTMARLNISYDLLTYEGDILRLQFWAQAFDILKASGAVFLQTEGKLAGCWVMRIDEGAATDGEDDDAREKVIVRSNGVVTYVGKDIANQFWKFGLLGRDFRYRPFTVQANGQPLWATTSGETDPAAPPFGQARRIVNVIDSRQLYLQALLGQSLRTLGHAEEADHSVHFSYEMVGLSHRTAQDLGYPADVGSTKPFVEVSGRKGLGVKIDDLLDVLESRARVEVAARNPQASAEECRVTAAQIAVAAIRYFMLKFSRGKLIVFDMEEALSFEGETGPYLQYAAVRAGNILQKLREREALDVAQLRAGLDQLPVDEWARSADADAHDLWALVFEASRLDEVVDQTVRALEFSVLAKYAFGLAQLFNAFYHQYPILNEPDLARRQWRAVGVSYVRTQLMTALQLMGIDVPARM